MPALRLKKSTIVRVKNKAMSAFFRYGEHVAPSVAGRVAKDLWFTAPPRMADHPVPNWGEPFEVEAQGHAVRGFVWGGLVRYYIVQQVTFAINSVGHTMGARTRAILLGSGLRKRRTPSSTLVPGSPRSIISA